jgi:transcriptional regulator with XRE-family HTH domain
MTLRKSFGSRIKYFREQQGWTQEDLAANAGISDRQVRRIEKTGNTTLSTVEKFATAFNVHPKQLLFPEEE